MSYRALYRTYRPATFEEVVGQQHIVLTIQNAIKKNKIAHAYLFCGPRGTGKTTIAKLVAKGVNCSSTEKVPCNECEHCKSITSGTHPDIVEIDAASNNGVDEIRDLIEKVKYSPIEAKYKVYIIDEVHMLSTGAFNALLKTLEEPPSHVIFILATTEPHKVLPTIISRCQRFDFTRVPPKEIAERVEKILKIEDVKYTKEVVRLISILAEGGLRDALSILEQVIAYAKDELKEEHVYQIYGISTIKEKIDLLAAVFSQDAKKVLEQLSIIEMKSHDIKRLTSDLIDILKESVIFGYTNDESILQIITEEEATFILSKKNKNDILQLIDILIETFEKYRNATNIHAYFEVCLLKMMSRDGVEEKTAPEITNEALVLEVVSDKKMVEPKETVMNKTSPIIDQPELDIKETKNEDINADKSNDLETRKYTIEEVVQCMVAADKPMRISDQDKWWKVEDYTHELEWAKLARLLIPSEIVISGDKFIVVVVKNKEIADAINETSNDPDYKRLMNLVLGVPKHIIAITKELFENAIIEFKKRNLNNDLPQPIEIEEEKIEKEQAKTAEEKALDLFGESIVVVSEE